MNAIKAVGPGAVTEADQQGYDAALAGQRVTANPYKAGTDLAYQWEMGWDEGFEALGGNLHAVGL